MMIEMRTIEELCFHPRGPGIDSSRAVNNSGSTFPSTRNHTSPTTNITSYSTTVAPKGRVSFVCTTSPVHHLHLKENMVKSPPANDKAQRRWLSLLHTTRPNRVVRSCTTSSLIVPERSPFPSSYSVVHAIQLSSTSRRGRSSSHQIVTRNHARATPRCYDAEGKVLKTTFPS